MYDKDTCTVIDMANNNYYYKWLLIKSQVSKSTETESKPSNIVLA